MVMAGAITADMVIIMDGVAATTMIYRADTIPIPSPPKCYVVFRTGEQP